MKLIQTILLGTYRQHRLEVTLEELDGQLHLKNVDLDVEIADDARYILRVGAAHNLHHSKGRSVDLHWYWY